MSTDGGATWTAPVRANQTPATIDVRDRQAFKPSVEVASDGSVGVGYYDFRNNRRDVDASQPLETDRFPARCVRRSVTAASLCAGDGVESRLTPASFDLRVAPGANGLFLGDFVGLASAGTAFLSLYPQASQQPGRSRNRLPRIGPVGHDRRYVSTAWTRRLCAGAAGMPSLAKICRMWVSVVFGVT
jgi:hypothetical protein